MITIMMIILIMIIIIIMIMIIVNMIIIMITITIIIKWIYRIYQELLDQHWMGGRKVGRWADGPKLAKHIPK